MPGFNDQDVEVLEERTSYQGFFKMVTVTLKHRLFGGGWSDPIRREVFKRGDAAAAILYDPINDTIGLIEQFRVGAIGSAGGAWCYEVVAGIIDPGEDGEQSIRRELVEEAGFSPQQLVPICTYLSSPGGSDEKIYLYCALGDLTGKAGFYGLENESEDIRLGVYPAAEVLDNLFADQHCNAATLIGLQWLVANRARLASNALA
ncbi:NUDIX domain-containing protein [Halioxenophilus aromaticivorans]|uniref:ADP-ribose pyrophosphatase n=1 Tax=Halioxenophilus aromaticivorans TaxID=1306992 RepID=A0AAV3U1N1_9ALTE